MLKKLKIVKRKTKGYNVFNEYMKIVCAYASTLSMESESVSADLHDLQIGKCGPDAHVFRLDACVLTTIILLMELYLN